MDEEWMRSDEPGEEAAGGEEEEVELPQAKQGERDEEWMRSG